MGIDKKQVYCTDCANFKIDDNLNESCIHSNKCDFTDYEDSRNFADRPYYEEVGSKIKAIDLYNILKGYSEEELNELNFVIEYQRDGCIFSNYCDYVDKIEQYQSQIRFISLKK